MLIGEDGADGEIVEGEIVKEDEKDRYNPEGDVGLNRGD